MPVISVPLNALARGFAVVVLCLLTANARAENWPQWRGPAGNGISAETNVPTKWTDKEHVAWRLPLPGRGGATPAVWGDRVFVTSVDGDGLILICVKTDGKEL